MTDFRNIAVLIDADNTEIRLMEPMLNKIATYGRIIVKRAYGNWSKPSLNPWPDEIKRLAISPIQQFDYVKGKNATDIALVIDAMELLYKDKYDCFVLVSSDSDYTPLSIKLRESSVFVIGVGKKTTPEPFIKACDDFILLENLPPTYESAVHTADEHPTTPAATSVISSHDQDGDLFDLMKKVWNESDQDGFAPLTDVGQYIKNKKITVKSFGYQKLADAIEARPDLYRSKKQGNSVYYQLVVDDYPSASSFRRSNSPKLGIEQVHEHIKAAWETYQNDGYAQISAAGSYLKRVMPDFDSKTYGYRKLPDLLKAHPTLYECKKNQKEVDIYKCLPNT